MQNIVLYEPRISPNTGNIIHLCTNVGFHLHLIKLLGFAWDDKRLRHAGLENHEVATIRHHRDCAAFLAQEQPARMFALTTKGSRRIAR